MSLPAVLRMLLRLSAVLIGLGVSSAALAAPSAVPLTVCLAPGGGAPAGWFDPARRFHCGDQSRLGRGDFWARPTALPSGTGAALTVAHTGTQSMTALAMYVRYKDGRIYGQRLSGSALSAHTIVGSYIEFSIPDRGMPVTGLLWHIEGSTNFRRVLGEVSLTTPAASIRDIFLTGMLYAGFAGLCLALIGYNLALWVALRQRFQLAYCAMVAAFAAYAGTTSGAVLALAPALSNNVRAQESYVLLSVAMGASLWFARSFFLPGGLDRRIGRLISLTIGWLAVTNALFVLASPDMKQPVHELIGLGFAATLVLTVPLLMAAWRRGATFLLIFALAWAGPAMTAWMRTANTFHFVIGVYSLQYSMIAIMAVEALLSSIAIAYRIHQLARERDEARAQEIAARLLADTDPLTGLLNRRAFLSRAIGRDGDQALVIVDIDHFKQVNETIGHDGGDEVLRIFARTLTDWAGDGVLIARMGGEEFAAVFDAAAAPDTLDLLDRLRVARMPYDLTVTASIGACLGPLAREPDWKRLYQAADRALFQAKAAGRDRSRIAEPLAA